MFLQPNPSPAFLTVLNEHHRKSFRKSTPSFSTYSPYSSTSSSYSPIYSSPLATSDLSLNESNNDSESLNILNKKFVCKHLKKFKGFHHLRLRRVMNPQRDLQRRKEYSMQIWILEAKGIPAKRKYYCELCFDNTLYAKTSPKARGEICFWGEHFFFDDIAEIKDVMINLYRDADPKKKKDRPQIIGYVNINTSQILSRHPVERWFVYILYF
uniref:C2 domain-containing protein n=1 Tax=Panagrolaimus davidi TaxID=227884 RepID=A0A914P6A0_9BILA